VARESEGAPFTATSYLISRVEEDEKAPFGAYISWEGEARRGRPRGKEARETRRAGTIPLKETGVRPC